MLDESRTTFITVGDKTYGLIYTVAAMHKIGEISGCSDALSWFSESINKSSENQDGMKLLEVSADIAYKICVCLEIMANAYIDYHSCTTNDNKRAYVPKDFFLNTLGTVSAMKYEYEVIETIYKGMEIEIPENLKKNIDADYIAIEAAKKNLKNTINTKHTD